MSGVEARGIVEAALRRELFGPPEDEAPRGNPLVCRPLPIRFAKREDSWGLWHDFESGEEILTESHPLRRYGVGILFAGAVDHGRELDDAAAEDVGDDEIAGVTGLSDNEDDLAEPPVEIEIKGTQALRGEADSDDFDLTDANSFKPSAMAISFECDVSHQGSLEVEVTGSYYDRIPVEWPGLRRPRSWWVRRPFELSGTIAGDTLLRSTSRLVKIALSPVDGLRISPALRVFSRRLPGQASNSTRRLVTLALMNTAPGSGPAAALYQLGFRAKPTEHLRIVPYPGIEKHDSDEEEESLALLYRKQLTYAIGHGCAANWSANGEGTVSEVCADPLPTYDVPS